jgi:hypothetical protein
VDAEMPEHDDAEEAGKPEGEAGLTKVCMRKVMQSVGEKSSAYISYLKFSIF